MVVTLGFLAALMTTASFLPQARQTLKTRSTEDFSWTYLVLFTVGIFLWMLYGAFQHDLAIFLANLIVVGLLICIDFVKWTEERRQRTESGT